MAYMADSEGVWSVGELFVVYAHPSVRQSIVEFFKTKIWMWG